MAITPETLQLTKLIDDKVNQVLSAGGGDKEMVGVIMKHMDAFKRIMDASSSNEMSQLCERYDGFFHFAKLLEAWAGGFSDGRIEIPG